MNEYFWVGLAIGFGVLSFLNAWQNHQLLKMLRRAHHMIGDQMDLLDRSRPVIEGLKNDLEDAGAAVSTITDHAAAWQIMFCCAVYLCCNRRIGSDFD